MFKYLSTFGVRVFFAKVFAKVFKTEYFYALKHRTITRYLSKNYKNVIDTYKDYVSDNLESSNNIYVFWYQGIDGAPELVKKCIESVKKHFKREVIIITKDNYKEYTDIDDSIIEKLNNGKITYTFFSDILRFNLLKNHGGLWLDATIFVSDDYEVNNEFFTIKNEMDSNKYVSKGRWTSYAIGGNKNNLLFHFMNDFFKEYLSKKDILIDYYLVDYAINFAYQNFKEVKDNIDSLTSNNINVYELIENINNEYSKDDYKRIVKDTKLHKLSYKVDINKEKEDSYYKMIIKGIL